MMRVVTGDVHPPFYYIIVKMFRTIYDADFMMRVPAFVSSVATIVMMYRIASEYGAGIARWAALLTAVMPAAVYYGAEARYPAFLALMLAIAYDGIRRGHGWQMSIALMLASWAHVNAWIYVALMLAVWLAYGGRWRYVWPPVLAIALWLPVAIRQAADVADGFWLPQQLPILHIMEMTIGTRFNSAGDAIVPLIVASAIITLSMMAWRRQSNWLWIVVAAGVPAAQWIVGIVWHPVYLPRTLLISAMMLIIPIAWWLDRSASRWHVSAGAIVLAFAIMMVIVSDRSGVIDDAVLACDALPIYATSVKAAVLAAHHSGRDVMVYERGATMAQAMPDEAMQILFDVRHTPPDGACIFSERGPFVGAAESVQIAYLLASSRNVVAFDERDMTSYVVMRR
jgi:hypothetical protein